jgi:NDP-sugar pyrophosphorylase family protein
MKKTAMIFAAGKGTRLGEITEKIPKALVPIAGKPLLFHIVRTLTKYGFSHIVINVHHHAQQLIEYCNNELKYKGLHIDVSDETNLLLDTGGGLKKAQPLFRQAEHVLLHNVDIVSNLNLNDLWNYHLNSSNMATLAVKHRNTSRYLMINKLNMLKGWVNTKTGDEKVFSSEELKQVAFSGVHVVSKRIFDMMPQTTVFSMTELYLQMCRQHQIEAYFHNETQWVDVGRKEHFSLAEMILQSS